MKLDTITKKDISIELIDSKTAKKYLTLNTPDNRKLKTNSLSAYEKMLKNDQWIQNGDTIKFDLEGKLIDGQHRLTTIINTGLPMECIIVRNLPKEAKDVLDFGSKRSAKDILYMKGHAYTSAISAATRIVLALSSVKELRPQMLTTLRQTITTPDIVKYVADHPEISENAQYIRTRYGKACKLLSCSVALALYTIFKNIDNVTCTKFFQKIDGTLTIDVNDPLFKLREKLMLSHNTENELMRQYKLLWPIQCWNIMRGDKADDTLLKTDFEIKGIK